MYTNKLKVIRKSENMTIQELSEKSGVSMGYISHLENGGRKNPSREIMGKIANALNRTVMEIFF